MGKPSPVQKLTPTAYDRWWRARINKEEGTYADKTVAPTQTMLTLNTLGSPQEVHTTALEDHLVGAGAMVRTRKPISEGSPPGGLLLPVTSEVPRARGPGSVVSKAGSRASKAVGSMVEVRSGLSYPKTPAFSAAGGGSVTDSQIMGRLERLEQDLRRERTRREAAEREMRDLLVATGVSPRADA
uniref:Uncharacterized protein n=1 Tax=Chlamydomonas leiostraca TaxID=1034604 RepID=A0A7S0R2X1_9CHLO|mmetsp:Transcript_12388/g.30415  ORF Transcript_12388/g.30415 Transcript_12388/m.30415 type:complete len:185 (+) Transcript_12388:321-875(+)